MAASDSRSNRRRKHVDADVAVVGLGYVGLTLAVAFANAGLRVLGYEVDPARAARLRRRKAPIHEPGLQESLDQLDEDRLQVVTALPDLLPPAVVLCVGTRVGDAESEPELEDLDACVAEIAPYVQPETLVVVRSTVPVGATRRNVVERLSQRIHNPLVACCPERTIQGIALKELADLPQVVGGEPRARRRAVELFGRITRRTVEVSSLETAELVKLVNNSHTDVIYGFGNEVALIAGAVGVDAYEVIHAANVDYPRPDISAPGYVGGSCLIKDPYLLLASSRRGGYEPGLVASARRLNEHVPRHIGLRVMQEIKNAGCELADATVLLSGIAYKGRPETDDVRGNAATAVASVLKPCVGRLLGHDFVVEEAVIAGLGLEPCELVSGCRSCAALVVLNNHPAYSQYAVSELVASMSSPRLVYDLWGVYDASDARRAGAVYLQLGREHESGERASQELS